MIVMYAEFHSVKPYWNQHFISFQTSPLIQLESEVQQFLQAVTYQEIPFSSSEHLLRDSHKD
jgi:hypothetical protein